MNTTVLIAKMSEIDSTQLETWNVAQQIMEICHFIQVASNVLGRRMQRQKSARRTSSVPIKSSCTKAEHVLKEH